MNMKAALFEKEYSERGHDQSLFSQEEDHSLESQAKSLSETYSVLLISNGEVAINGQTHTWQEVLDEDLDNILELQRKLHFCHYSLDIKIGAQALKDAQQSVVNEWAIRTARQRVGL